MENKSYQLGFSADRETMWTLQRQRHRRVKETVGDKDIKRHRKTGSHRKLDGRTQRDKQRGQTAAELAALLQVPLSAAVRCSLRALRREAAEAPADPVWDSMVAVLLERSSSSSGPPRPAPGNWWTTVGPGGWQGIASMGWVSDLEVSGAQQCPVGPVGLESRDERVLLSRLRWGWQWHQAVQAVGQLLQLRGLADSGHTHDGVSPSPCADRRTRSSVRHYSHCKSHWPCARSSSSSGCGGGQRRWSE